MRVVYRYSIEYKKKLFEDQNIKIMACSGSTARHFLGLSKDVGSWLNVI